MTYAIMYNPGHNRVYYESSLKLALAEFSIVGQKLSLDYGNLQHQAIYEVDYLTFEIEKELDDTDVKILSNLSFFYALFRIENINNEIYLKPIEKIREDFVDESISTILKYTGKTNEIFTRMMINLAYYSQNNTENINLLDPVAGKGTTLYEGLIKGFSVYGIEIGETIVTESYHFIKRFLETSRYKFEYKSSRFSGPNRLFTSIRHTFVTAKTKEDFKAKNTKTIEFIAGNSLYVNKYYKKDFFDIIVGDLPYGVQHSNVTNEKQSSLTRNPYELLSTCLPSWHEVLKPNGIIALAWNSNVLSRSKIVQLFEANNLTVKNEEVYLKFEHKVDQSIQRDIIIAQKTS